MASPDFKWTRNLIRVSLLGWYDYLRPEGFFLFTNHKNVVVIFDPVSINSKVEKHVARKIER